MNYERCKAILNLMHGAEAKTETAAEAARLLAQAAAFEAVRAGLNPAALAADLRADMKLAEISRVAGQA